MAASDTLRRRSRIILHILTTSILLHFLLRLESSPHRPQFHCKLNIFDALASAHAQNSPIPTKPVKPTDYPVRHVASAKPTSWSSSDLPCISSLLALTHPFETITFIRLISSGDIEPNPGPTKFPCGICNKPVKRNQRGVLCDSCGSWFHAKCSAISSTAYDHLTSSNSGWICNYCDETKLPFWDSSTLFSDNSTLSSSSSRPPTPSLNTATSTPSHLEKFLTCYHTNARSAFNKRQFLQHMCTDPSGVARGVRGVRTAPSDTHRGVTPESEIAYKHSK